MMQRKQRPPPTRGRGQRKMIFLIKLRDGVWTEFSTFAGFAMLAYPYFIKLVDFVFVRHDSGIFEQARMSLAAPSVHGLLNDFCFICQDARFKIAFVISLHSNTSTCEVRASHIHLFPIKDKYLKPMEQREQSGACSNYTESRQRKMKSNALADKALVPNGHTVLGTCQSPHGNSAQVLSHE